MKYLGITLIFILLVKPSISQNDSLNVKLVDTKIVSDGTSRYSEPKISPKGTQILTTRNLDTLCCIDLVRKSEKVLLTGGRFIRYCWINDNEIYYHKRQEKNSVITGESGKIYLEPFSNHIDYTFSRSRYDNSKNSERVQLLAKGKFDVYFDIKRRKMYRIKDGQEIEITPEKGIYYKTLVSNDDSRIIIQKNDGKAYNYDFNGSGECFAVANGLVSSWSPDDKYLLYFNDNGYEGSEYASELYICTSDGEKKKQITYSADIDERDADWSRNSDWIAFLDNNKYQISVAKIIVE